MFGSILSPESDSLNKSWASSRSCTGITIKYTGSNTFESDLPVKVNGGNAPDLAIIPQPGLLTQMVLTGKVKKPPAQTVANENNWSSAWKGYGSVGGTFYAAPMSANMKSLVWYSPKYFAAHNYTVPTTWADLIALSNKIVVGQQRRQAVVRRHQLRHRERLAGDGLARGGRPGHLRRPGLRRLDQPQGEVLRPEDHRGDDTPSRAICRTRASSTVATATSQSIATTTFQNAGLPILKNKCAMLQQASFYEAQWPKGTKCRADRRCRAPSTCRR